MGLQTYLPIEILDYVQTHEPSDESVYGIGQRELAKALGYHPCSMSRPLEQLVAEGLLLARRGLVRDGRRKQLTYRLTPAGLTRLKRETSEVPLLTGDLPPPPHPFLGRKEELDQLMEFSHAGGSVTLVDGPPGMGKSALVSRHLRRVKRGRIPFWFTVRPASSPRQFVSALSHALSFLGNPQLAYYSQLPRNPVAREVADLAAAALGNRPLVAIFDDMQLAEPDLRQFLTGFVNVLGIRGEHQFYVVSQDSIQFEATGIPSHRLTVGGLDRVAAHELTDRHGGLAARFEHVYQSTLGSPLLLRLAVSQPNVLADASTLPAAVLKKLPPEDLLAILPGALSSEALPASFILDQPGLTPARLEELAQMGLLQKTVHDRVEVLQVVRTAVLARVGPAEEREAHLRLARFYGRSHRPEALRERFLHLVAGEDWKGSSGLLDEQQRVVLRLGYSEPLRLALRQLSRALPHGSAKIRVLFVEASLLRHHSEYAEAISSLRKAITESDGDAKTRCEALLSIVELNLRLSSLDRAQKEFESATEIGPVTRRLQAYFLLTRARLEEARGGSRKAAVDYQRAFELAKRVRAPDLALESIAAWSKLAELTSGPQVALEVVEAALPDARQSGRMDVVFNILLVRARAYLETGRSDLAESEMIAIRSEAESLGYLNHLTYTLSGLAAVALERGRWTEVAAYAKQASELANRLGNDLVLGHTLGLLCSSEFRQVSLGGDPRLVDEAIAHGQRSVEVLSPLPPTDSLVLAHAYLSEAYLFRKDFEKATEQYDLAIDLADKLGLGVLKVRLVEELAGKLKGVRSDGRVDSRLPLVGSVEVS
ncbi:MAG: AAA family ATPase [Thermoplasmata archaeon]